MPFLSGCAHRCLGSSSCNFPICWSQHASAAASHSQHPHHAAYGPCQLQQSRARGLCQAGKHAISNTDNSCQSTSTTDPQMGWLLLGKGQNICCLLALQQSALITLCLVSVCVFQVFAAPWSAVAEVVSPGDADIDTFENVPGQLRSEEGDVKKVPLGSLFAGSKRKEVEGCTRKCVPTCIRGGEGAPGLGPISMRREVVVFKEGFRSRGYCLSECAEVCSLSINRPAASEAKP